MDCLFVLSVQGFNTKTFTLSVFRSTPTIGSSRVLLLTAKIRLGVLPNGLCYPRMFWDGDDLVRRRGSGSGFRHRPRRSRIRKHYTLLNGTYLLMSMWRKWRPPIHHYQTSKTATSTHCGKTEFTCRRRRRLVGWQGCVCV